jgi:hypothetical protein
MPVYSEMRQKIDPPPPNVQSRRLGYAREAILLLTYAKLWGRQGKNIVRIGDVRIDHGKDLPNGGKNIQIQLDDDRRSATQGTTIAQLTIDGDLQDNGADNPANLAHRQEVLDAARRALQDSLDTAREFRLHQQ